MRGDNPLRPQELNDGHLWVQEVFYTLQGEGPFLVSRQCLLDWPVAILVVSGVILNLSLQLGGQN